MKFQSGIGARMDSTFWTSALFFLAYFAFGSLFLNLVSDWWGFALEEGALAHGAMRLLEGATPYRDFFFPYPPLALSAQVLAQKLGVAASFFDLVAASLTASVIFHWSATWAKSQRALLALLLLVWNFGLWNISQPAWLALSMVAVGIGARRVGWGAAAGAFFALAFWCHQWVGIGAFAGALFYWPHRKANNSLLVGFALGVSLPGVLFFKADGELLARALFQMAPDFSALGARIPSTLLGAPLVVLGLWNLSLYFFRVSQKMQTFSLLAVLAYLLVSLMRDGGSFFLGCFFMFALVTLLVTPLLIWRSPAEERRRILPIFLSSMGGACALLPHWDFPHFLIFFPFTAFLLVWCLRRIVESYGGISTGWIYTPIFILLAGGLGHQSRLITLRMYAQTDGWGKSSYGDIYFSNQELAEVKNFLVREGLSRGDEVFTLPTLPIFYFYSGFKNPVPSDWHRPRAEAAFGLEFARIVPDYRARGGRFVVVKGELPTAESDLLAQSFRPVYRLPRFAVWEKKPN